MQPPPNVRVRGLYNTALTVLLLTQGCTIVDASPAIEERFGIVHWDVGEDVRVDPHAGRVPAGYG